jgi:hypothetical protein
LALKGCLSTYKALYEVNVKEEPMIVNSVVANLGDSEVYMSDFRCIEHN